MNQSHPMLVRFAAFIVLPLIIAVVLFYHHLQQSLPPVGGEIVIEGIGSAVTLSRDQQGLVAIQADSDEDAFFALGYAHAQDRLWQLEVQKRTVQGRLSEIFGKQSVTTDIWFRTLGLYQKAAQSWDALSPAAQASLNAYAAGINAWLDNQAVLPPEFLLLDIQPQHWHVNDSLAYIKLFALNLSGNFRQEIARMLAAEELDDAQLATVFATYPADAPITVTGAEHGLVPTTPAPSSETSETIALSRTEQQKFAALLALQQSLESRLKIGGRFVGSNGWVVAPQHSQNGQALLANDPHLGLQIPSLWYGASLQGAQLNVSGMTLVGLPLVIFGRNQDISWGGTSMTTDNQDLYFERINPEDPSLYLAEGQWQPFTSRTETLSVRADFPSSLREALEPVEIKIRSTRHGPVISDIFAVFEHPVALRWTALTAKDTSYEAFFRLNYAANWTDFGAALSHHVAPGLNMLYADRQGNIGYVGAGQIPMRKKGQGDMPVPGWSGEYQWTGMVPPAQWPRSFNPAKGYIVNANNKVVGDDYPYFISKDWAPGARAKRIGQRLTEILSPPDGQPGRLLTSEDMGAIQADTISLPAQKLLPLLQAVPTTDADQQQAVALLSAWDGDMHRQSQAAALFTAWSRQLRKALFADELTGQWGKTAERDFLRWVSAGVSAENVAAALSGGTASNWCDDVSTTAVEDCDSILRQSLEEAMKQLDKLEGRDPDDWQWGKMHHTAYDHQPFSQLKLLDTIFERHIENGGGGNTVNVSGSAFKSAEGYLQNFGAGFRQIISMGPEQTSHLMMNSTGQSGNVLSEHYDDMVRPFRDVDFVSMKTAKEIAKESAKESAKERTKNSAKQSGQSPQQQITLIPAGHGSNHSTQESRQ